MYNDARWHFRQYEIEAQELMNGIFPIYKLYDVYIFQTSPDTEDNSLGERTIKWRCNTKLQMITNGYVVRKVQNR